MFRIDSYRRELLDIEIERHRPNLYGTVLDIGGGTKRGNSANPESAPRYITLDNNIRTRPTVVGDAEHLPFKDGTIDSIKCTEVLEYINNPEIAVSEMHRVLMDKGEIMVSVPFNMGIHYDIDLTRFTKHKLENMFGTAGFKVIYLTEQGLYFTCLGYMLKQAVLNTKSRARWLLYWTFPLLDAMVKLDGCDFVRKSQFLSSFTTGYFMVAINRIKKEATV